MPHSKSEQKYIEGMAFKIYLHSANVHNRKYNLQTVSVRCLPIKNNMLEDEFVYFSHAAISGCCMGSLHELLIK